MHARVTAVQGPPENVDVAIKEMQENVLPAARQLAGFKGIISLSNRETGKGLTITLWESQEALQASEEAANRLREQAVQAIGSGPPTVDRYEVTIFEPNG
jgi:heme-degrading monooxygenase HmoA